MKLETKQTSALLKREQCLMKVVEKQASLGVKKGLQENIKNLIAESKVE